jgi:hypothetical protein
VVVVAADVFRRWAERRIEALPEAEPLAA